MIRKVLGIDLASSKWSAVGSATIEFDDEADRFTRVVASAIRWPAAALSPEALADAIDAFARREGICAVALDGPQGWRDPATPPATPGVGRRCEYECRTQGKTGVYPRTFPGTQRGWIELCVEVFANLLGRPGVELADPAAAPGASTSYVVLECFPTSAWRSSGLVPLPAKGKRPVLARYARLLTDAHRLPPVSASSHDDLQAVVAALTAAAAAGGPAVVDTRGVPGAVRLHPDGSYRRIEGFIWNVKPLARRADENDEGVTTTLRSDRRRDRAHGQPGLPDGRTSERGTRRFGVEHRRVPALDTDVDGLRHDIRAHSEGDLEHRQA